MLRQVVLTLSAALLLLASWHSGAQQSQRFGPYELHYNVVNTTFLTPEVAARYGIVRGNNRAILNVAVREHLADGSAITRPSSLQGQTRDLTQVRTELEFQEVREGPAVYYIASFRFLNREWRHFELTFRPEGAEQTYTLTFTKQLFKD